MAKKAKGNRVQVILECTEHKTSGMPGTSRYITNKNRKNTTERMELKKYNPILRKVTDAKTFTKVIRMVKKESTGGYQFVEQVLPSDEADKLLSGK
jgi:large subunit ribosomal protein L33